MFWWFGNRGEEDEETPFEGTPITLHALDTYTLLHAEAPAGTGNIIFMTVYLTDESGNRLTDQDGNYLTAFTMTTAVLLHADATETTLHG